MGQVFELEIYFPGGRYEMCTVTYCEEDSHGGIRGKYLVVQDKEGREHIARPAMGTWMAFSSVELIMRLKELDKWTETFIKGQRKK